MAVKPIPEGYHTLTPYLVVKGAARALDFYKKAFGATELFRMAGPDDRVMHAEFKIGNSMLMIGDEYPEMGPEMNVIGPATLGGTPVGFCLYVEDADAVFAKAVAAGAKVVKPLANQFYGDRSGTVTDPFGHKWTVSTHIEDVTPEECERRMAAMKPGTC